MESLKDKLEEAAFYNHDSNRAVAVLWPAIIDNRLTDLLRTALIPAPKEFSGLFSPGAPVGDFVSKAKLAYLAGLIHADVLNDLKLIAKIRNAFAHRVDVENFETKPVCDWLNSMKSLQIHKEMLKKLEAIPESEMTSMNFNMLHILQMETMDYRNSFHCCVRYLIHHIVGLENKRKEQNARHMDLQENDTA